MEKIQYKRFVMVRDQFYSHPLRVAEKARKATYFEPEDVTGFRSTTVYHEPGVKRKLESILGIRITRWDKDPELENGVFYQAFSHGSKKEVPGVHADFPVNDMTILIYLTPGLPFDCGTSLWMHKRTGLCNAPTQADARRLKMRLADLKELLEEDTKKRSRWVEIDRIGNQFNRMVAYPSGVFHSGTRHYGSHSGNGRLYQTFRVGVDWNSFRMYKK